MSELAKKLRDLAERLESHASGHTSGPISHAKATVYLSIKMDLAPLLTEAERLEAQNARLRELVMRAYAEGHFDRSRLTIETEYEMWKGSAAKAALDKEESGG